MTELLSRLITELEKLSEDQQDAIAIRLLSEIKIEESSTWTEQDQSDLTSFSLEHAATNFLKSRKL